MDYYVYVYLFLNYPCFLAMIAGVLCGFSTKHDKFSLWLLSMLIMAGVGFLAKKLAIAGGDELKELLPFSIVYFLANLFVSLDLYRNLATKIKTSSG